MYSVFLFYSLAARIRSHFSVAFENASDDSVFSEHVEVSRFDLHLLRIVVDYIQVLEAVRLSRKDMKFIFLSSCSHGFRRIANGSLYHSEMFH